jgi:hypothetical protein
MNRLSLIKAESTIKYPFTHLVKMTLRKETTCQNLEGHNLDFHDFGNDNLYGTLFQNSKINYANLSNAKLTDCNFHNASCVGVILPDDIPTIKDLKKKLRKELAPRYRFWKKNNPSYDSHKIIISLLEDDSNQLEMKYGALTLAHLLSMKSLNKVLDFYLEDHEFYKSLNKS